MYRARVIPANHPRGFALAEIIIVIVVLGLFVALGVFGYRALSTNGGVVTSEGAHCKTTDGIEFCVKASAESVAPTDGLTLKATLKNHAAVTYATERTYSSSCNAPSLKVNGEGVMDSFGVCTDDITSIHIDPGETREYDVSVDTSPFKQGKNTLTMAWDGGRLQSKPITVTLREATATDEAKSQSCLGEQEMRPYCTNVMIVFESSGGGSEEAACKELETYIKPLGLAAVQSDCNLSDIGILTVNVPSSEADEWVQRINQIPEVKSANAS